MIVLTVLLGLLTPTPVLSCTSEAEILAPYADASESVISERLDHLMEVGSPYYMYMMQSPVPHYEHVKMHATAEARYYLMVDENGCVTSWHRLEGIET